MKEIFSNYSDQEAYRIARLIAGFIRGTLSKTEHIELDDWVAASDENMQLFERLTDEKNLEQAAKWMESVETEKALQEKKKNMVFNRPATGKLWLRLLPYTVAASVIIVVGLIVFKPFSGNKSDNNNSVTTVPNDILPGGNKAVLTLADGRNVALDSAANGALATQGNTSITKSDGQLEYANATANGELLYNTISTPKGGQYRVTLSDGSKVWLNTASSIYYPVAFAGNERTVIITGEAYFEVAKDVAKPFKVKVNDAVVEVLGTHFNINAYDDEPVLRTTLMEGSVKVSKGNSGTVLMPGQEAQINTIGEIKTAAANNEQTLAWKNGSFLFKDAPIENIMRQIARWYDAEIVYEAKPADHFNADVSREMPVSKLLHYLELTNRVHFKIENKKIIVMK
jgi:transmembrane sensor